MTRLAALADGEKQEGNQLVGVKRYALFLP
jgi:hypothetical protein